jgi:hypothetical protein
MLAASAKTKSLTWVCVTRGPPVFQIDHAHVVIDVDPLLRRVGRGGDVATAVLVGKLAVAFDRQGTDCQDAIATANGVCGACGERTGLAVRLADDGHDWRRRE